MSQWEKTYFIFTDMQVEAGVVVAVEEYSGTGESKGQFCLGYVEVGKSFWGNSIRTELGKMN